MGGQLRFPPVDTRLDDTTKTIGRRGIAKARAVLAAHRPDPDLRSLKQANQARQALTRATTGRTSR